MKKTKIITTVGPATKEYEELKNLALVGTDIIRINMKHADYDFAEQIINKINQINKELNKSISIMLDLKGPDITVGKFSNGSAYLNKGDKIRIYADITLGDSTKFSVNYPNFVREIKVNTVIKLNDGLIELRVIDKEDDYLLCEVVNGGFIEDKSGVNVIDAKLNIPFLSKKDIEDINFANRMGVDFLALSFVSNVEDVLQVNDLLINLNNDHMQIISKIETEPALEEIDEIIKNSDGIMVARGDLGVEIPLERVPGIQKSIISKCHIAGKVSIVATEMMSTMENNIRPTRAEVNDVANAVLDGVDIVMLSGETTIGKYPIQTVDTMVKIIETSELDVNYYEFLDKTMRTEKQDTTSSIAYSVVECANRMKCKLIITPTMTGYTTKKISRFRPSCPIIALSPDSQTVKELSLYYGVYPILIDELKSFDKMMDKVKEVLKNYDLETGSRVIVTGGYPFKDVRHTNFMKIEEL